MGKYPLDPDHIVFLGEGEVLQPRAVKVTGGGAFENLAGFGDVFLALVDNVHLVIYFKENTFWKPNDQQILVHPVKING